MLQVAPAKPLAARTSSLVPAPRDRPRAVVLGLLFVAYIGLLVAGEATVDAGTASMLAETSPLLTAALAAVTLGERIGGWLVEAWLDRAPLDAPTTAARGPSFVYDVRAHQGPVVTLVATEAG